MAGLESARAYTAQRTPGPLQPRNSPVAGLQLVYLYLLPFQYAKRER